MWEEMWQRLWDSSQTRIWGWGVHQHPPLGNADAALAGTFSQRVHWQGGTWGTPKPRAPRQPQGGRAAGDPHMGQRLGI